MATIKDVAKVAGVAPSTVSNTLNGRGYVSAETRDKVLEAVELLDYQPNPLARGLKSGRTNVIALIVPTISTPMFSEMIEGVEEVTAAADRNLILCRSGRDPKRELAYLNLLKGGQADGIIFAAPHVEDPCFDEITKSAIPTVIVGGQSPDASIPTVTIDNRKGAREALLHLLELDHRKIAFINGPTSVFDSRERYEAVKEVWDELQLPEEDLIYVETDFTRARGYDAASEIMNTSYPPTAIFAACDSVAIGAVQAIKDMGLIVPDDVTVVGFDDIKYAQYVDPPLTTVRQPAHELGQEATRMLLSLIKGKRLRRKHVVFEVQLQVRQSSARRG